MHTLKGHDLPHYLPPNEGIVLGYDLPGALDTHPDGLPPGRECLFTPVLARAALQLSSAVHVLHKLLLRNEERMCPLIVEELQIILLTI